MIGDVAAILAQMRRDAVRPGLRGDTRGAHRIGVAAAARIADRRDVVDVDAEAEGNLRDHRDVLLADGMAEI